MIGFLIFCFVLLMVLPVLDLPLATSVPIYVWLLLLLLDIFLIGALLRRRKTGRSAGPMLAGLVLAAGLAVAASQW
mgnify:CR=1 FL=1